MENSKDFYASFNDLIITTTYNAELHTEATNCVKKMKIESQIKEGDWVYLKNEKSKKIEATVRRVFRLLSGGEISEYALILVTNEHNLEMVLKVDELIIKGEETKIKNIERTESGKRYYMVQTQCLDLEVGLIFCIFEDPKCTDEFIIYSKDLDVLITKEAKTINEKIKEDDVQVYFKRIDETTAKHLYPIAPRKARIKVDISLISSLKEGDYVISKHIISKNAFIHKKEEIGGFYFYLLHVKSKKCKDDFKLINLFLY